MKTGLWILVTWDEDMPLVRSYEDESDAIEALKDALPIRDKAYLYATDKFGTMTPVQGW